MRARIATAHGAVLLVGGVTIWFGQATAPRDAVPAWLLLLALSAALLTLGGMAIRHLEPRRLAQTALLGALVLRAAALFAPVSLSDDVNRYVWDGTLVLNGHDPYAHRPVEVVGTVTGLDTARLEALNSPGYYTIYPPLSQLTFALGAAFEPLVPGALVIRALFAGFDLLAVWALLGLLRRLERPRWWALLYAWNPLVFWEMAAGAHTEALLVPLLLCAACAAMDERPWRTGALLGLAVSAKLTAVLVAPLFLVYLARRVGVARALGATGLALGLFVSGFAPFASPTLVAHLRESLALFSSTFSFNAPIYYGLRFAMGYLEGLTPGVDPLIMPALAAVTLGWLALMTFAQDGTRERLVGGIAFALLGVALLSRVVHPWYVVPVLAFGVAARSPSIVLASLVVPLSYLRYDPIGHEAPWVIAAQFAPLFLALFIEGVARSGAFARRRGDFPKERDPAPPMEQTRGGGRDENLDCFGSVPRSCELR